VVKCIDGRGLCCTMFVLNVERNQCFSAHTVHCDLNARAISQHTSDTFIGNLSHNYFIKSVHFFTQLPCVVLYILCSFSFL
jgi:hypothetical protein